MRLAATLAAWYNVHINEQITEQTHLSRPAVSHHLKILYDAEVSGMTKQATKHFYYLAFEWQTLVSLVNNIEQLRAGCAREGESE